MPRRPIEIKNESVKNKKQNSIPNAETNDLKKNQVTSTSSSPPARIFDNESKEKKKSRRKSSILRRLLSFSIITYLGYYVVYGCGSPFDSKTSDKPAVCEPIDTFKLDVYSLFDTEYAKKNINPYIIDPVKENYQRYGVPIQKKSKDLYKRFGVPCHQTAKHVYAQSVAPRVNQVLSSPFIQENQNHAQKLYNDKLNPWMEQTKKSYKTTQETMYKKYQELPPPVLKKLDQLKAMYDKVDSTELKPILVEYYWTIIDFYQEQFKPLAFENRYALQLQNWVNGHKQTRYQSQYQRYIEPYTNLLTKKFHLNQLYKHLLTLLPQRQDKKQSIDLTMADAMDTVKEKLEKVNPHLAAKSKNKPILSKAVDSIKAQIQKAKDIENSPSPAIASPFEKIEQVEDQAILL